VAGGIFALVTITHPGKTFDYAVVKRMTSGKNISAGNETHLTSAARNIYRLWQTENLEVAYDEAEIQSHDGATPQPVPIDEEALEDVKRSLKEAGMPEGAMPYMLSFQQSDDSYVLERSYAGDLTPDDLREEFAQGLRDSGLPQAEVERMVEQFMPTPDFGIESNAEIACPPGACSN
jgi:hypothetical protein